MIYGEDILIRIAQPNGYIDEMGDYIVQDDDVTPDAQEVQCDAQAAGKDAQFVTEEGEHHKVSYTITIDRDELPFRYGDIIELRKRGLQPCQYRVLGYQPFATHAKIWV